MTSLATKQASSASALAPDFRLALYRDMVRIRAIEECIADHYSEQEMRCPVHLSIGQEAAAVGACAALERTDYVLSGHRAHAHYLAKGGDLNAMMAEIYGKATGCVGGVGGSMHLLDLDAGFLGCVPIVGSTIAIASGVAFAARARGEKRVTMVFLGEGATETGAFYETVNFAALKDLPLVFLVENNFFSVYSPMDVRQKRETRIVDIAAAHGIPAQRADGNDVERVYELSREAVQRARSGGGPSLLEFTTYRWREHCGPNYDNNIGYRSEADFLAWKERCPLVAYEQSLAKAGVAPGILSAMPATARAEAEAAVAYAKNSPWPELAGVDAHVTAPTVQR